MALVSRGVSQRIVQLCDGVVVFWVVLWLAMGAVSGVEVWRLTRLSDTAEVSARAVDRAGEALQAIGALPLVGDRPTELGADVRAAAAEIEASAIKTRTDVRRLAVLLGLSIFAIPVAPVVGLYLPLRLRRRADVASIRASLRTTEDADALDAYLAGRAVQHLTFAELRAVTPDPIADLNHHRYDRLATAELRRLGIRGPPRRSLPGRR